MTKMCGVRIDTSQEETIALSRSPSKEKTSRWGLSTLFSKSDASDGRDSYGISREALAGAILRNFGGRCVAHRRVISES